MIDNDLYEMFADRESLAPDTARLTGLIATRIQQREKRLRVVRAVAVAAAVLVVVGGVSSLAMGPAVLEIPPGIPSSSAPAPGPAPGPTPGPTASLVGRLVEAPDSKPTIAVQVTWLPPALTAPKIDANVQKLEVQPGQIADVRSLTYEQVPIDASGTLMVGVQTYTANPQSPNPSASVPVPDPSNGSDSAVIDVNGHPAQRDRSSTMWDAVRHRDCFITWQQRPALWVMVMIRENLERSSDPALNCDDGERVARGLVDQPRELLRAVRLTVIPRGFEMVATGTGREMWCLNGLDSGVDCVRASRPRSDDPVPGVPVTVHGHPGTLNHDGGGFLLHVPDRITISSTSSDLTDEEILMMADTAILDGGW